jgi:hypothetical protein
MSAFRFRLHPDDPRDQRILAWLETQPCRHRSAAVKDLLDRALHAEHSAPPVLASRPAITGTPPSPDATQKLASLFGPR